MEENLNQLPEKVLVENLEWIDMKGITGKKPLKKGVTIFLVAAAACVILGVLLSRLIGNGDGTVVGERGKISIEDEYIGRLDISGTISESEGEISVRYVPAAAVGIFLASALLWLASHHPSLATQIGRASCRERV